jgi:DNA-binding transcriptional ArsR family regulator
METLKQIDNLETLKVLSDPLRIQLIEAIREVNLQGELATVKYLSEQVGRSPKKLYYHVNLLEKHDLIQVADTRLVSGIVEKLYQVSAQSFVLDESIFSQPAGTQERADAVVTLVSSLLDATKREVTLLAQSHAGSPVDPDSSKPTNHISKDYAYLTPEQVGYFQQRLQELSDEFDAIGTDASRQGTHYYSLTAVFFPLVESKTRIKD